MKTQKNTELHIVVKNLIKIRNDRQLSQLRFAELIGISNSAYNKIESGQQQLSLDQFSKIAIILKMSEPDIFTYPHKHNETGTKNEQLKATLIMELKNEMQNKLLSFFDNEILKLL